jgi:uncharacterized repeat protein (TIGR03803 family)
VLYSFCSKPNCTDGSDPAAGLIQDAGNLYGTTVVGGAYGYGTVFKLAPPAKSGGTWTETVLYSFTGGTDGANPWAGLVQDAQGNLYGTAYAGGNNLGYCDDGGCGTVFKLAPPAQSGDTWTVTVLYNFTGSPDDGANPYTGSLVQDAQGNLYGTTLLGGNTACESGCGTVFTLAPPAQSGGAWAETVLHSFCSESNCTDGEIPDAGLVLTGNNLYGTTSEGGDIACFSPYGCGTVFELAPPTQSGDAWTETVLHSFSGIDGDGPSGLVQDTKGNLYGTTNAGGGRGKGIVSCSPNYGCGTAFKLAPPAQSGGTWTETVLYGLTGTKGDGSQPLAGLVLDTEDNLYGTTYFGGDLACFASYGCGTVFKLATASQGTTTTLESSANPSAYEEAVTFTATVAPAPPNGEIVTFMDGKKKLGTETLSGGTATYKDSTLKVGTASITAVYAGDTNYAGSTSAALSQVVDKATTSTALTSSVNPSTVGESVTFTATVTPEYGGTVTGKVSFYNGTTLLKSVTVSSGKAAYATKTLTEGKHSITATYEGSTDFSDSTSSVLTQTVNE